MTATGRCLCGAVTYEAHGAQPHVHACHCGMCRRWSGGPSFGVQVERLELSGTDHVCRYPSSDWAERAFCTRCGTHLFYRLTAADQYICWQGSFDDQSPFELDGEIYVDEKPPGYDFAGDHSRMTGAEFMASLGGGGGVEES